MAIILRFHIIIIYNPWFREWIARIVSICGRLDKNLIWICFIIFLACCILNSWGGFFWYRISRFNIYQVGLVALICYCWLILWPHLALKFTWTWYVFRFGCKYLSFGHSIWFIYQTAVIIMFLFQKVDFYPLCLRWARNLA